MNNFYASYSKILEILSCQTDKNNFKSQIRKPRLSDLELISICITAEYLSIDSECQLFRMLPPSLSEKIERSVYNRRKRGLFFHIEGLRRAMATGILENESTYIVDSMPLEVCKLSRSSRSRICRQEYETAPDKGYCASQKMHYYGYKFHGVCGLNGVFGSFDLTKASVHDIHYLKDIKCDYNNCTMLGDKGYISAEYQLDMFASRQIRLEVPMRENQIGYKKQPYVFKKCRKRIETLLSQLCDQFMVRRNYAKTFEGFKTRILAKITAMTVVQIFNKLNNRNLNNLKIKIA